MVLCIIGDIRVTPFYSVAAVHAAVEGYISTLNSNLSLLYSPTIGNHGPHSKYTLPDENNLQGHVQLTWIYPGMYTCT